MSKSVAAAMALALCVGFGGGYVARGSLHLGPFGPAPSPAPSISAAQEFVAVLTFCAHVELFPAIERDLRRGRTREALKRLKDLSSSIRADANLFDAAHDSPTADDLRMRAKDMTSMTTLDKLTQLEGSLEGLCRNLRQQHPSPST